jgi:hypothetical protein
MARWRGRVCRLSAWRLLALKLPRRWNCPSRRSKRTVTRTLAIFEVTDDRLLGFNAKCVNGYQIHAQGDSWQELLYKVTEVLTREMPLEDAVNVWQQMCEQFSEMFNSWNTIEKMDDPVMDGIVAHYCKVLKRLITKAEREYRSYAETAHLLASPANAKRLKEALEDTRGGRVRRWGSVEELIKSKRG